MEGLKGLQLFCSIVSSALLFSFRAKGEQTMGEDAFRSFLEGKNLEYIQAKNPHYPNNVLLDKAAVHDVVEGAPLHKKWRPSRKPHMTNQRDRFSVKMPKQFFGNSEAGVSFSEFQLAKDMLEQLQHSCRQLKTVVERAETDFGSFRNKNGVRDSASTVTSSSNLGRGTSSIFLSLDHHVSPIVNGIHQLLASWTFERYAEALVPRRLASDEEGQVFSFSQRLECLSGLIEQLNFLDRLFVQIQRTPSYLPAGAHTRRRAYEASTKQRVQEWQRHSGMYETLQWLICLTIECEMQWLHHLRHIKSTNRISREAQRVCVDKYHHQNIYRTVWSASRCLRRLAYRSGSSKLSTLMSSLACSGLCKAVIAEMLRLDSEEYARATHKGRSLSSKVTHECSVEEWCLRWWLCADESRNEEAKQFSSSTSSSISKIRFKPPFMDGARKKKIPLSDSQVNPSASITLHQAANVLSVILNTCGTRQETPNISLVCGTAFVESFIVSLDFWFSKWLNDSTSHSESRATSFWIKSITLACRGVEAFAISSQNTYARQSGEINSLDKDLPQALRILFQVLLRGLSLIESNVCHLDGKCVSYLLFTLSMLGFSGDISNLRLEGVEASPAPPSSQLTNIYVSLIHRASQLADTFAIEDMQRVLEAVKKIQISLEKNQPGSFYSIESIREAYETLNLAFASASRMRKFWQKAT